jgi:hypothetical protein
LKKGLLFFGLGQFLKYFFGQLIDFSEKFFGFHLILQDQITGKKRKIRILFKIESMAAGLFVNLFKGKAGIFFRLALRLNIQAGKFAEESLIDLVLQEIEKSRFFLLNFLKIKFGFNILQFEHTDKGRVSVLIDGIFKIERKPQLSFLI